MPVLTFKVSLGEARAIRAKARAARAPSLSDYLRKTALGAAAASAKPIRRKHPVSGLPFNAGPGPKVTAADIHAALADFP